MLISVLAQVSKDHVDLAIIELQRLLGVRVEVLGPGLVVFSTSQAQLLRLAPRLGLCKACYEIKKIIGGSTIPDVLRKIEPVDIESSYKCSIVKRDKQIRAPHSQDFANALYSQLVDPQVDIHHPQHHYIFFWGYSDVYFCEQLFVNTAATQQRRAHLREENHPTSLHPKLARAMISLSGVDSFHDPFCGSGGILIEAGLLGLRCSGSDISQMMLSKARKNILSYNINVPLFCQDALEITGSYEAIITDFPFGKNSRVSRPPAQLLADFLLHAQSQTTTMVLGVDTLLRKEMDLSTTKWKKVYEYTWRVHASMSRTIMVLEQYC